VIALSNFELNSKVPNDAVLVLLLLHGAILGLLFESSKRILLGARGANRTHGPYCVLPYARSGQISGAQGSGERGVGLGVGGP